MYTVPQKYFYRLHHIRPRFKSNCEEVLSYVAGVIMEIGQGECDRFKEEMRRRLFEFPGNATYKLKTIDNWRTEISTLFALYFDLEGWSYPTSLAQDLSESQDLTKFFKYFVHSFQYPGGHLKPETIVEMRDQDISFHPASFLLQLLEFMEREFEKEQAFINKAEATHCVFNDLRVTAAHEVEPEIERVAQLIFSNRKKKLDYDWDGDVTRYAGDILDYMSLANLMTDFGGKFRARKSEKRAIERIKNRTADYEYLKTATLREISEAKNDWFIYCDAFAEKKIFETDVLAFIAKDEKEYEALEKRTRAILEVEEPTDGANTKRIGDYGEGLIYGHECMELKSKGKIDLIHLIKCIPNHFAVGYDIQSIDENLIKKYIEVKTSISSKRLNRDRFALTLNEISSAQTLKENYYIYRLVLNHESSGSVELRVIRNPIDKFKNEEIQLNLRTGEVVLDKNVGEKVELLSWEESA